MSITIIAEAGVNHNGHAGTAINMIRAAADAGADIVKFQTFQAHKLASKYAAKAEYQTRQTGAQDSQLEMLQALSLAPELYATLLSTCERCNVQFLSTPFDLESIAFLDGFAMPFWKLPSGEITNLPYLIAIANTQKPVVMSTGMCQLSEVEAAIRVLQQYGTTEITLLHCNTEYPTPYADVNLNAMLTLKKEFGLPVGYSDHTLGIEVPIAAAALGATVIEKHFTLDKAMPGPDHKASLEPEELTAMVQAIRHIEAAMGDGKKAPSPSEAKNMAIARKSIVAARDIQQGELLTADNITTKRPGNGVSPMQWFSVLGTAAVRDFAEDELIQL